MQSAMVFAGLGFELIGLCMGGYYFGHIVDQYMGWSNNYGAGGLVLLLLIGWFVQLFYLLRRFEKDNADDTSPKP